MRSEGDLVRSDLEARALAVDVTQSYIVQAPAGSGKTELLIQRYLHLLAVVDEPEEILAITFTRKAAMEMQQRVVRALRQAQAGETSAEAHEQLTLSAAARVLERDADHGWRLIAAPRRMRILTLDAFCAGIARLLPLSSGLGGTVATVADAEARSAYRAAAVATLDWLTAADDVATAVEKVLDHLDNSTGIYVDYLSRMLETRDQWLEITGPGEIPDAGRVRRRLESNIAAVVRAQLAAVASRLAAAGADSLPGLASYAANNLRDAGVDDHPIAALAGLESLPGSDVDDLPRWRGLAELLLTRQGQWRRQHNRNSGFPPGDAGQKKACLALIADLSADESLRDLLAAVPGLPAPRYPDSQWEVLLSLFRLLPLAVAELHRVFTELGVTDHNEVARAAETALGRADAPGDLALMLDYRIRHVLVDEMQDTSVGQYRLLETLTGGWEPGDGRTLFCVGDPMQSIYRFRNAEVGRFVLARESGVAGLRLEPLTLRQNFRSGERLVHWYNEVFGRVFPAADDIASGAIAYTDSVPVKRLRGAGDCRVHPLFDADPQVEAGRTADIVADCLGRSSGDSVAVLVRSRTQLPLLLAELRRRRIDYRAVEIDRLTDLPEIIDLLALTRAFSHAADRIAWLGLLRGPLVGLTWADLHTLVRGAPTETVWNLIRDESRVGGLSADANDRLAALIPRLRQAFAPDLCLTLRERIERAWYLLGGPAYLDDAEQLDNTYRFFAALDRIDVGGTLPEPAELEHLLDEERVSSRPADDCRLQVMTMHKAKGLQFDHVILPALGRTTSGNEKAVLSWLDIPGEHGRSQMIISPVGARFELENDPLHRYIEASLRASERLELDRLLYVACTRARKTLHLVGHLPIRQDRRKPAEPHAASPLARLWPALAADFRAAYEREAGADAVHDPADGRDYAEPVLRRATPGWTPPAPGALPQRRMPAEDAPGAEHEVEFRWVGGVARAAGTLVHRWLERLAGVDDLDTVVPTALDARRTRRWARRLGVGDDELSAVCDRVHEALAGILSDERGRWILRGVGHAELALTGLADGRIASVVIDRVRIDDDGTHWIVDYKTGTHEGGDLDRFLRQEAERYRPQLARYAEVYGRWAGVEARTALYFPLLRKFVEVPATAVGPDRG